MEKNYTMNEILNAINDLNSKKINNSDLNKSEETIKNKETVIPKDTMRLIEEAEKAKNQ